MGVPVKSCLDGGPQFSSKAFSDFISRWDIQHVMSSPHYDQSMVALKLLSVPWNILLSSVLNMVILMIFSLIMPSWNIGCSGEIAVSSAPTQGTLHLPSQPYLYLSALTLSRRCCHSTHKGRNRRPLARLVSSSNNILFYLGTPNRLGLYTENQRWDFMSVQNSAEERVWRHSDGSRFHLATPRKK